ncbi:endolytic transglycosylase MltG [Bacteroidetes/Chlorobi group bacterium ChocPot_Mid]|jgi:UPF0755 protein|nr:MAG: endolytic transglycosylase MltG [Bacteroidetes/Chlorobi group bacterium ChocPot_Mid]
MSKIIKVIAVLVLISAITTAFFYLYISSRLSDFDVKKDKLIITIPQGNSMSSCLDILNKEGVLQPSWLFDIYLRIYSTLDNRNIIAGTYKFTSQMDNNEIIQSILTGKNLYTVKVTYPEGITLKNFAEITWKKLGIPQDTFLEYVNSPEVLQKFKIQGKTAEGYLMPNTFTFFCDADVKTVVKRLLSEQERLWERKFEPLMKHSKLSKHQILTLASIIEAESPVAKERARVSGVYHNRLEKKMLLQADPTIAYIVGGNKKIKYSDLKLRNPYNTYLFAGLPPGPINSPSESSIEAALKPEQHNYLFFVAKGDGSMLHSFATNFREHQRNIASYRKNRKLNSSNSK